MTKKIVSLVEIKSRVALRAEHQAILFFGDRPVVFHAPYLCAGRHDFQVHATTVGELVRFAAFGLGVSYFDISEWGGELRHCGAMEFAT